MYTLETRGQEKRATTCRVRDAAEGGVIYHVSRGGAGLVLAQERLCAARAIRGADLVGIELCVTLAPAWFVGDVAHPLVAIHKAGFAKCVGCDRTTAGGWRRGGR